MDRKAGFEAKAPASSPGPLHRALPPPPPLAPGTVPGMGGSPRHREGLGSRLRGCGCGVACGERTGMKHPQRCLEEEARPPRHGALTGVSACWVMLSPGDGCGRTGRRRGGNEGKETGRGRERERERVRDARTHTESGGRGQKFPPGYFWPFLGSAPPCRFLPCPRPRGKDVSVLPKSRESLETQAWHGGDTEP